MIHNDIIIITVQVSQAQYREMCRITKPLIFDCCTTCRIGHVSSSSAVLPGLQPDAALVSFRPKSENKITLIMKKK